MKFSIIKMHRDEFREGDYAIRTYYITFFGIPLYSARFTSTNNDAVYKLTAYHKKEVNICGFKTKK